jgi:ribonuclease HII
MNTVIAGIDEAGRGCLAGPVVAGAVIINQKINFIDQLKDSKKLSPKKHQELYHKIVKILPFGIGVVDEKTIDEINILQATKLAMQQAYVNLEKNFFQPDLVLVDGNFVPKINVKANFVIKGDDKIKEISAASIIAKFYRDSLMKELHQQYRVYNWQKNKGYATKEHREAIKSHGICKYHRLSFSSP